TYYVQNNQSGNISLTGSGYSLVLLAPNASVDISSLFTSDLSGRTGIPGRFLAVYAGGDITAANAAAGAVTLNATGSTGGALLFQAGVNGSYTSTTHSYSFSGPSATGGSVTLVTGANPLSIQTNSTVVWVEAHAAGSNPGPIRLGNINTDGYGAPDT